MEELKQMSLKLTHMSACMLDNQIVLMDEAMMHKWINQVVIPWRNTRDPGFVPLLILEACQMHMMGSLVNSIKALGIEVQHILGSCPYLCQPVDVSINHPNNTGMLEQW